MGQLALAWLLRDPVMTAAIVGARKPGQITETFKASGGSLSAAELEEIELVLKARETRAPELEGTQLRPQAK